MYTDKNTKHEPEESSGDKSSTKPQSTTRSKSRGRTRSKSRGRTRSKSRRRSRSRGAAEDE